MTNLLPSDTPFHIRKKQIEMVLEKSNEERLRQCFDMIQFSYSQTMNLIKKELNTDDEELIKFTYIERCYKDELSEEYFNYIKSVYLKNKNK